MEALTERLAEKLTEMIESSPFNIALCRQCMENLILFTREHKELDQFEDFEFDQECVKTRSYKGIPRCCNQITLLKQGQKTSLTFKMFDDEFEDLFSNKD